jgi:hypothetical protein
MPIDYRKYPKNWRQIRAAILERAGQVCEWPGCGAQNGSTGYHDQAGRFLSGSNGSDRDHMEAIGSHPVTIVLTVAHMDHDVANNDPQNLRAWCQLHHNRYDAPHRAKNRAATLAAKRGIGRRS